MNSKELSVALAEILEEKKAQEISVIDVANKTTLAEFFVLASANTSNHVKALSDEVLYQAKEKFDLQPLGVEGLETGRWVLLDFNSVIVHIMHREDREFYKLDSYWSKKESENISSSDQFTKAESES